METWSQLGFNKDIELKYSTPTAYARGLKAANAGKKDNTTDGWPVRKDDTFPFSNQDSTYLSGYYSSRPQLKK